MPVTGVLLTSAIFTGLDALGDPLSGGLLYAYAPGTTTPQTTYSDSDLATPNQNPVVLDSAGRATVYLDPALGYKFVLKNSAGTTQYTQDNAFLPALPVVHALVFGDSPYTVTSADGPDVLLECNCTAGAITVIPYTAIGNAGKRITVKKTDVSANAVTVDPTGAETIDGASTATLTTQYSSLVIQSDGSNWVKTTGDAPNQSVNVGASPSFASPTVTTALNLPGGQIVFPATQVPSTNANTLDDYEETISTPWLPVIGGAGGTSGQTYAEQVGLAVKIGRHVHVSGRVRLSTLGTVTGNVQLQGLPYAADATSGYRFAGLIGGFESFTTSYVNLTLDGAASATVMTLYGLTAASTGNTVLATANLTANTGFTFSASYVSAT